MAGQKIKLWQIGGRFSFITAENTPE